MLTLCGGEVESLLDEVLPAVVRSFPTIWRGWCFRILCQR